VLTNSKKKNGYKFTAHEDLKIYESEFLNHKDPFRYKKDIFDRLNQEFCYIFKGSMIMVINREIKEIYSYSKMDFLSNYGFYTIISPDYDFIKHKDGDKYTYVSCADLWLKSTDRLQYLKTGFSEKDEPNVFNTFIPEFLPQTEPGDVLPILKHILEIWCKNVKDIYEYTIKWLAFTVQKPFEKIGVSFNLASQQGAGKGIVIEKLLDYFGCYFKSVRDCDVLGNFNSAIEGAFVLFFDEQKLNNSSESKAAMKRLITEKTLPVVYKGKESHNIVSTCNVIMATNNERHCNVEANDRRNFCIELDNKYAGPSNPVKDQYFAGINAVKSSHFIHYLKNVDISNFNPREFPVTDELKNQMLSGLTALQSFWYHVLGYPPENIEKHPTSLDTNLINYRAIDSFRIKENIIYPYTEIYDYFNKYIKYFSSKYSQSKYISHIQFFQMSAKLLPSLERKRKNVTEGDKKVKIGTLTVTSIIDARNDLIKSLGFDPFAIN